jgi:hypothetical protein
MALTLMQKIHISLIYAVLFAVLSLPIVYKVTNMIIPKLVDEYGCPTLLGILVHSIVFLIISVILMSLGK